MTRAEILSAAAILAIAVPIGVDAADIGVIPSKLVVVDKLSAASKAKVVYVSRDQAAGITKGSDENENRVAVRFDVAYGDGSATGAFLIPPQDANSSCCWTRNDAGLLKYVNKRAPAGATEAKVAIIKSGKLLKLVGKGVGDAPLDLLAGGDPGVGGVQTAYCVTNGTEKHCHCSDFTGCTHKLIAGGTGAKLVCKTGVGDPTCTAVPECYVDTGSTVIDTCHDLEWEKKDTAVGSGADAGNLHDVDNRYSWAGQCALSGALCQPDAAAAATCAAETGGAAGCAECGGGEGACNVDPVGDGAITTIWDWVNQVNAATFAGHADWRLATSAGRPDSAAPSGEPAELESIVDFFGGCRSGVVCIDPIFGPTVSSSYWSASTVSPPPAGSSAWGVSFFVGDAGAADKSRGLRARAVRPTS